MAVKVHIVITYDNYHTFLLLHFTEGTNDCSIEDVQIFVTGCERVPPLGFGGRSLRAEFLGTGMFCTSSTCDLILRLPLSHGDNYKAFQDAMIMSLKNNDGFGGL